MLQIQRELKSDTPKPQDPRRKIITNRLHHIGDTVFIIDLHTNGTIIDVDKQFVIILPHDYGYWIQRTVPKLRAGQGINCWQRD